MRRTALFLTAVLVLATVLGATTAVFGGTLGLKEGSRGDTVSEIQGWLYVLGYLNAEPSGFYGVQTVDAVKRFQADSGLTVDGITGTATWTALSDAVQQKASYIVRPGDTLEAVAKRFGVDPQELAAGNSLTGQELKPGQELKIPKSRSDVSRGFNRVELVPWEEVNAIYADYGVGRVIDVDTGLSFLVQRRGGHYHADSEPLTMQDTVIMKRIFGGAWSWNRRAVVFELRGRWIAASINGMPHGGERVTDNGFPGHFCIHFYGSKIHKTGRVDPAHQQMILKAASSGR